MSYATEKTNRLSWIDIAKGICILAVIAGHSFAAIAPALFFFHLGTFFILSGYTCRKEPLSKEWIEKKFKVLMYPYFITCFAVTGMDVLNVLFYSRTREVTTVTKVIAEDITRCIFASGAVKTFGSVNIGTRIGAIWFLPGLFFALLFLQMIRSRCASNKACFATSAVLAMIGYISARFLWLPFSIQSAMFAMPFMVFGSYCRESRLLEHIGHKEALFCAASYVVAVATGVKPIYFVSAYADDIIPCFLFSLCACICILKMSAAIGKNRFLEWCGRNSLIILTVHLFELETLGGWFRKPILRVGIPFGNMSMFIVRMVFILSAAFVIGTIKKHRVDSEFTKGIYKKSAKRDYAVDGAKGILIILMLIGHYSIDPLFRTYIYSFHMAAFVVFSGFFYRRRKITEGVAGLMKGILVPYILWSFAYIALSGNPLTAMKTVLFGMSFSGRLFTDIDSIGPMYFVLMLFCVRLLFLLIDGAVYAKSERIGKWLEPVVIIVVSMLGYKLGGEGYWLPWSFDCAMYLLGFYYASYLIRYLKINEVLSENKAWYFMLATVWLYFVYRGGMEIAIRAYGTYSMAIFGALAGILLLYLFCSSISKGTLFFTLLSQCGKNTLYILMFSALFSKSIYSGLSGFLTEGYAWHFIAWVTLQVAGGLLLAVAVSAFKRINENKKA